MEIICSCIPRDLCYNDPLQNKSIQKWKSSKVFRILCTFANTIHWVFELNEVSGKCSSLIVSGFCLPGTNGPWLKSWWGRKIPLLFKSCDLMITVYFGINSLVCKLRDSWNNVTTQTKSSFSTNGTMVTWECIKIFGIAP